MKITFFISALSGGGAERVTCNLANYMAEQGHQVEILTMAEREPADSLKDTVKHVPLLTNKEYKNKIINNVKRVLRLRKYMKSQKVDAYVVMLPKTTELMLRFRKLTKSKIIVSERVDPKTYNKKTQKTLQKLSSRANGYVFQTDEIASWYAPYLKGVESRVIPNAINPAFIRKEFAGEREKKIVAVGRLAEQKNFPLLIKAFSKISDKFLDYKLVFYGKGGLQNQLEQLALDLGVKERLEFCGFCEDMPERLERASMFVLSSDYEGMPNALMEAMAVGVPCVSTDCGGGGARFLIEDGENGILVPVGDEDKLSQAIEKILGDRELANKLSKNGRKLQEKLSPSKIYGKWEEFIKKICE